MSRTETKVMDTCCVLMCGQGVVPSTRVFTLQGQECSPMLGGSEDGKPGFGDWLGCSEAGGWSK